MNLTTAAQLAQRLGITPDRVGAIARALGMSRIGRDWLFTDSQVAAISAHRKPRGNPTFSRAK